MASFLSFPRWAVPASLQKRLVTFLLKRAIGQFLLEDLELDEHLDIQLGDGRVVLRNVHLNTTVFNELFQALPVRVQGGIIGTISVHIPWSNLWSGNCELQLSDIDMSLLVEEPKGVPTTSATPSSPTSSADSGPHIMSSSLHFADDFLRKANDRGEDTDQLVESMVSSYLGDQAHKKPRGVRRASTVPKPPSPTESSVYGLKIITEMIDKIISRVNLRFINIRTNVTCRHPPNEDGTSADRRLEVILPQLDYEDRIESPVEDPDTEQQATQWFRKIVRFSGLCVKAVETPGSPSSDTESESDRSGPTSPSLSTPTPNSSSGEFRSHTLFTLMDDRNVIHIDFERLLPFHAPAMPGSPPNAWCTLNRPLEWRMTCIISQMLAVISPVQVQFLQEFGAALSASLQRTTSTALSPNSSNSSSPSRPTRGPWSRNDSFTNSAIFHSAYEELPVDTATQHSFFNPATRDKSPLRRQDTFNSLHHLATVESPDTHFHLSLDIDRIHCVILRDNQWWNPSTSHPIQPSGLPDDLNQQPAFRVDLGAAHLSLTVKPDKGAHITAAGIPSQIQLDYQLTLSHLDILLAYLREGDALDPVFTYENTDQGAVRIVGQFDRCKGTVTAVHLPPLAVDITPDLIDRLCHALRPYRLPPEPAPVPAPITNNAPLNHPGSSYSADRLLQDLTLETEPLPSSQPALIRLVCPRLSVVAHAPGRTLSSSGSFSYIQLDLEEVEVSNRCSDWRVVHPQYGNLLGDPVFQPLSRIQCGQIILQSDIGSSPLLDQPRRPGESNCFEIFRQLGKLRDPPSPSTTQPPPFSFFDQMELHVEERVERSVENGFADAESYKRQMMKESEWVICAQLAGTTLNYAPEVLPRLQMFARTWSEWAQGYQTAAPPVTTMTNTLDHAPVEEAPSPAVAFLVFNRQIDLHIRAPNIKAAVGTSPKSGATLDYTISLKGGDVFFHCSTAPSPAYISANVGELTVRKDRTSTDPGITIFAPEAGSESVRRSPLLACHLISPSPTEPTAAPRIVVVLNWVAWHIGVNFDWMDHLTAAFNSPSAIDNVQASDPPLPGTDTQPPASASAPICISIHNSALHYSLVSIPHAVALTAGLLQITLTPAPDDPGPYHTMCLIRDLAVVQRENLPSDLSTHSTSEAGEFHRSSAQPTGDTRDLVVEMDSHQVLKRRGYMSLGSITELETVIRPVAKAISTGGDDTPSSIRPFILEVDVDTVVIETCSDSLATLKDVAKDLGERFRSSDSPAVVIHRPSPIVHYDVLQDALIDERVATESEMDESDSPPLSEISPRPGSPTSPASIACPEVALDLIDEYYSEESEVEQPDWDIEWVDRSEIDENQVMFIANYSAPGEHRHGHRRRRSSNMTNPHPGPTKSKAPDYLVSTDPTRDEFVEPVNPSADLMLQSQYFAAPAENAESSSSTSGADGPERLVSRIRLECKRIEWNLHDGLDWAMASPSAGTRTTSSTSGFPAPPKTSRSTEPLLAFVLTGFSTTISTFSEDSLIASRFCCTVRDAEILDHCPTSGWRKFMAYLKSGSHRQPRESDSNMFDIRVALARPDPTNSDFLEFRLHLSILPLRFYIDQDTLGFLLGYFMAVADQLKANEDTPATKSADPPYIQFCQIDPITLKVDYKPKQLGFDQIRDRAAPLVGLVNLFPLQDAKMTLKGTQVTGIKGWDRLGAALVADWIPHITHTQIPGMVTGVSPIRSAINLGTGVVDLLVLPIEQYKKDGRVVKGLQNGARSFNRTTASEAIKIGTKFTSTAQSLLEKAGDMITTTGSDPAQTHRDQEELDDDMIYDDRDGEIFVLDQPPPPSHTGHGDHGDHQVTRPSRFADQPQNLQEGMQQAYRTLAKNFNEAAQTILAIPAEVYEKSGQDSVQTVLKAVPIAILKPMIGTSEALSKTLLGLRNTLDPSQLQQMEDIALIIKEE
ncbi:autophagy- protein 2 [Dimargaris cristalligena]|nr:autophagy- protein 2 [Dimargaris cristalligena]